MQITTMKPLVDGSPGYILFIQALPTEVPSLASGGGQASAAGRVTRPRTGEPEGAVVYDSM